MIAWLPTLEDAIVIHEELIRLTGGEDGIRDQGLIDSALARAKTSFSGLDAHQTLEEKAAAVGCGLIKNHGFIDGNKRVGITTMMLILLRNGVSISYTQSELVHLGLNIAQNAIDVQETTTWIIQHKA